MVNDRQVINAIRVLAAETVQKANSGHPGMPIDAAPAAFTLWKQMKQNPKNPLFPARDRFVLSSGHASALEYVLLHLFGYGVTMDDLKSFRQWGSRTPGHPEHGLTPGVEATTGPLGQGFAMAVGMAMAEAHKAAVYNRENYPVVDNYTYVLMGDGCMMEGVTSEAASLAGTLKLGKLIALYDRNCITIEGSTDLAFTEDVGARFDALGWHVQTVENGEDTAAIARALEEAKRETDRPSLIIFVTKIACGTPLEGSNKAHGAPLGEDNLTAMKLHYGWEGTEPFSLPQEIYDYMGTVTAPMQRHEDDWNKLFARYQKAYPELAAQWAKDHCGKAPDLADDEAFWHFEGKLASRQASGEVLNRLLAHMPNLFGGSADLAPSNMTVLKGESDFSADNYAGKNIHFGVREFAMACACNGMALYGGIRPYCGTFFVFSDYLKPALRLSALMKLPVLYILTHDSIGVGEDGPTHQPIEHLAALRATPDVLVFRPADSREVAAGYVAALENNAPVALALSRQTLPLYEKSGKDALKGGYILREPKNGPDVILMGSGSEVELLFAAADRLAVQGYCARIVSMPCMELFERQDAAYRESVLPGGVRARVAVEAGATMPWYKYVGLDGEVVGRDAFGASAPQAALYREFGITADAVAQAALRVMGK